MDNPFKKLEHPPLEVPEGLKKKVMDDVAAFQLFADLTGLFSANYTASTEQFFKKRTEQKKNN